MSDIPNKIWVCTDLLGKFATIAPRISREDLLPFVGRSKSMRSGSTEICLPLASIVDSGHLSVDHEYDPFTRFRISCICTQVEEAPVS